jgi:hypothetical protein
MLDVHPAHHAATTWRDFFIHIATIVIGLLIAVGLEQTVEAIHHRHQLHLAREAIYEELMHDHAAIQYDVAALRTAEQAMRSNAILLQSPQPESAPGSALDYTWDLHYLRDDAWQDAKSSGAAGFMAPTERAQVAYVYSGIVDRERAFAISYLTDTNIAKSIAHRAATIDKLTPQDRDQLLKISAETEGQIVSLRMVLELSNTTLNRYLDQNHLNR